MFKENKQFWLYFLGIILLFFLIFRVLSNGFSGSSWLFSDVHMNLFSADNGVLSPSYTVDPEKDYQAIISTNLGDITVELYAKNAPNTVANFISLANRGYYDSTIFHRLIKGYILQGGSGYTDVEDARYGNPGYTIADEINWDSLDYPDSKIQMLMDAGYKSVSDIKSVPLTKYSVAMATNGPGTGGSQFFIVLADSNDGRLYDLEGKHTVFGHVIGGFTVLEQLNSIEIQNSDPNAPFPVNFKIKAITIRVKD